MRGDGVGGLHLVANLVLYALIGLGPLVFNEIDDLAVLLLHPAPVAAMVVGPDILDALFIGLVLVDHPEDPDEKGQTEDNQDRGVKRGGGQGDTPHSRSRRRLQYGSEKPRTARLLFLKPLIHRPEAPRWSDGSWSGRWYPAPGDRPGQTATPRPRDRTGPPPAWSQ